MMRAHPAGTLHAGQTVTLAGWVARRRDHRGVIFIDRRDVSGVTQVAFREGEMAKRTHRLRSEYFRSQRGQARPGRAEARATRFRRRTPAAPDHPRGDARRSEIDSKR